MSKVKKVIDRRGQIRKQKGIFGDKCLKVLMENKDEVLVEFLDEKCLTGLIKGVGEYTFMLDTEEGDRLIFKHSVKVIGRD